MPVRAVRSVSEAPKRSAVRNAPTLASARGTPKKYHSFIFHFEFNHSPKTYSTSS
ncbi:MAG: hypothetical protein NZ519_03965 [Bacteroidia bacterium]|nr:hypothetical protein [Bacteroidia bacterium]